MNPSVVYEMNYYIFEQKIFFILSRTENVQNKNFWKQYMVIKGVKQNLTI